MRSRWRFVLLILIAPALFARDDAANQKWRDDLAFFRAEMPRVHKNLFHTMPREEFERMINALAARVPWLEDHEIAVELGRIVAGIGDGHTHLNFGHPSLGFRMLPVRFYQFSDGMFIRNAADRSLVGAKVVRIGTFSIEQAVKRMAEVSPRDNDSGLRAIVALQLGVPEILHALRIAPSKDRVTLRIEKDGRQRDVELTPVSMQEARGLVQRPEKNFSFEYLRDSKVLYVQYNSVSPQRTETGATSPAQFFDEVFAYADAHPVEKLVIDLRRNGGGNNTLNLPIIHGLIRRERLKVFALIGRETFSAAQNFVNLLETHTRAVFAGEPTGGRPNHFGDPRPVRLPNSGLEIRASTLWWQDVHPADARPATLPHIAVELSSADFFAGRDPVLDAVIRAPSP
jgi:Peptidase family S41